VNTPKETLDSPCARTRRLFLKKILPGLLKRQRKMRWKRVFYPFKQA
jgi:hypothetical protein